MHKIDMLDHGKVLFNNCSEKKYYIWNRYDNFKNWIQKLLRELFLVKFHENINVSSLMQFLKKT